MATNPDRRPNDEPRLSEDRIFTLLSAQRRREVLRLLDRAGGQATMGHVTTEIAADEHGSNAAAAERKAVYVSLYQTHIPRLVDAGVVEYDGTTKLIRVTDRAGVLLAYLRFDPEAEKPGLLSRVFRPERRESSR